ncbi:MAG: pyrroline-5-carboxylate reductase dimerization domain-containing protein [Bacillota bacterium]
MVSEEKLNIIMALASPAPVYLMAESLMDAGVRAGLHRDEAVSVVMQLLRGTGEVWEEPGMPISELRADAGIPGGISVERLHVLEPGGLRGAVSDAVRAGVGAGADLACRCRPVAAGWDEDHVVTGARCHPTREPGQ